MSGLYHLPGVDGDRPLRRIVRLEDEDMADLYDDIFFATSAADVIAAFERPVYMAISNAEDRYCWATMKKDLNLSIREAKAHGHHVEYMFYLCALDRVNERITEWENLDWTVKVMEPTDPLNWW